MSSSARTLSPPPHPLRMRCASQWSCHCVAAGVLLVAAHLPRAARQCGAQEPLRQGEPYAELTVSDGGKTTVLRVRYSGLDDVGIPPSSLRRPGDTLRFELVDGPAGTYEVKWRDVVAFKPHEQLVLEETRRFLDENRFDEAYENLLYLGERGSLVEGLDGVIDDYLIRHAQHASRSGDPESAYFLLDNLFTRNQSYPLPRDRLNSACDALLDWHFGLQRFTQARALLQRMQTRFAPLELPVIAQWESRLQDKAAELVAQAHEARRQHDLMGAHAAIDQAVACWPDTPGVSELSAILQRVFPIVRVGVSELSSSPLIEGLCNWAARRDARLLTRSLFEFERPGPEGGIYVCPAGEVAWDADRLHCTISIAEELLSEPPPRMTSRQLAMAVLGLSGDAGIGHNPLLHQGLRSVDAERIGELRLSLEPQVRPEGILQIPLGGATLGEDGAGPLQPFVVVGRDHGEVRFQANPRYRWAAAMPLRGVVLRRYESQSAAWRALCRGEVDIVDRIPPRLSAAAAVPENIVIRRYAAAWIHLLVPNYHRPLPRNRAFRRALVYGIDRAGFVRNTLVEGSKLSGCEVIDGPFPVGHSLDDPIRHALDPNLPIRDYEPTLAAPLLQLALRETAANSTPSTSRGAEPAGRGLAAVSVSLAHPADEISRLACEHIRRDLERIGLRVKLEPLADLDFRQGLGQFDFAYVPVAMWEPAVDVRRLLGRFGLARGGSDPLELALSRLARATNWNDARASLRQIHRLVQQDVTVVPLWQVSEHFALRSGLEGVGESPSTLFDSVEDWRPHGSVPPERRRP